MADIIKSRRDTAENWRIANPTLAEGELGFETDTKRYKLGDGKKAWNDLEYRDIDVVGEIGEDGGDSLPTTAAVLAKLRELGYYEDNPEYVKVITDSEGRLLFGIKTDGSIDWAVGVPAPVKEYIDKQVSVIIGTGDTTDEIDTLSDVFKFLDDFKNSDTLKALLEEKVDKEDGQSLIDAEFAGGTTYEDHPEFVKVVTDSEGRVLAGIRTDGTPYFPQNEMYHVTSNPEWLAVWTDASEKIIFGFHRDGSVYVGNADFLDTIKEIKAILNGVGVCFENIDFDALGVFSDEENPEWIDVKIDREGKILEGTKRNGSKYILKLECGNANVYNIDNPEYLMCVIDTEERVLYGIKRNGEINTPNRVSLSENSKTDDLKEIVKFIASKSSAPYDISFANSYGHLYINPYGNINQCVHPKVLYFESGLFGHKYWMAVTPYPYANAKLENPCILYSDDGINWTGISANPLSVPDDEEDTYNSDAHLVYREDTRTLECWYRYVGDSSDNRLESIRRRTSTDGIHWNKEETLFENAEGGIVNYLSPAILWEDGQYHVWLVSGNQGYHIEYMSGEDPKNLKKIRDIRLSYKYNNDSYYPWHIDVIKDENQYILLVMCKSSNSGNWTLFLSTSSDNVNYSDPKVVIKGSNSWDKYIYRSSIIKIGNEYCIYYSARDSAWTYNIGFTKSDKLEDFIGGIYF